MLSQKKIPCCFIAINGVEIKEFYSMIESISVTVHRDQAAVAEIKLRTACDNKGQWKVQDNDLFTPWNRVKIYMEFIGDKRTILFSGFIREIQASYPNSISNAKLSVICQDQSLALNRRHQRKIWGTEEEPTNDEQILKTILNDYRISLLSGGSVGMSSLVLYQDSTDIQFIQQRAQANGYELNFVAGTEADQLYFGPMRLNANPQKTIFVYAGKETHCNSVNINFSGEHPDKVGFDAISNGAFQPLHRVKTPNLSALGLYSADQCSKRSGLPEFTWLLRGQPYADEKQVESFTQAKANEAMMKLRAEGELNSMIYGEILQVGLPVGLDGIGNRLSGLYYVDEVVHKFDFGSYTQQFTLSRNAYSNG